MTLLSETVIRHCIFVCVCVCVMCEDIDEEKYICSASVVLFGCDDSTSQATTSETSILNFDVTPSIFHRRHMRRKRVQYGSLRITRFPHIYIYSITMKTRFVLENNRDDYILQFASTRRLCLKKKMYHNKTIISFTKEVTH